MSLNKGLFFVSILLSLILHSILFLKPFAKKQNIPISIVKSFQKAQQSTNSSGEKVRIELFVDQDSSNTDSMSNYVGDIFKKIEAQKFYPEIEKERGHEATVKLDFTVAADGHLLSLKILEKAKYAKFNVAALKSIRDAAPFEPIPDEIKKDTVRIVVEMEYLM